MPDEPSSAGASRTPKRVESAAAAAAASEPRDLNSRIERRMWLLHKGADRAEARAAIKFGRHEFRIYVNGGLLWSRNYALDDIEFDGDAAAKRDEFLALGWELPVDPAKAD